MRWMSKGAALAGMAMIAAPAWADDRFASCVGRVALISAYHSTASGQGYAGVVLNPVSCSIRFDNAGLFLRLGEVGGVGLINLAAFALGTGTEVNVVFESTPRSEWGDGIDTGRGYLIVRIDLPAQQNPPTAPPTAPATARTPTPSFPNRPEVTPTRP